METLKVGTKSNPNSVAGALANVFREKGSVEIQAIGAGALNQAIKAIAIARGFVAPSGKNLICIPAFTDIVIDGEERTAIKLIVETIKIIIMFLEFKFVFFLEIIHRLTYSSIYVTKHDINPITLLIQIQSPS